VDNEISAAFQKILKKQGVKFELDHKVTGVEKLRDGLQVSIEPAKGGAARTLDADIVLVAIGRRPFTKDLGLETVGVKTDSRGFIPHDGHLKVAEGVYVIGDVTTGAMLAHKAEEEGIAVAQTIAGLWGHVNYEVIPNVIYTYPEVATVGKSEEELKAEGVEYKIGKFPFMANSRARTNHETDGLVKVLEEVATKKVAYARRRRRRNDRRGLRRHGIRRLSRRHRPHVPRPPHHV
jgi:dihydrolipoamide dehydrogenase